MIQPFKKAIWHPGQCGSVGWALSHKAKGHQFDSLSWVVGSGLFERHSVDVFPSH